MQPFGHNRHGPKMGGSAPFFGEGSWIPINTMSLGSRPTFLASGILIHRAIWPQQIWAENWRKGLCPFCGWGPGSHLTQCGQAEAYLRAKFHLDPSNSLVAIHQRYRQDRQDRMDRTDRQRSDSIGRTVLQTVAQKFGLWSAGSQKTTII